MATTNQAKKKTNNIVSVVARRPNLVVIKDSVASVVYPVKPLPEQKFMDNPKQLARADLYDFNEATMYARSYENTLSQMGYRYDEYEHWTRILHTSARGKSKLLTYIIKNKLHPDIAVQVEGKLYYSHMIALQCYCTYFDHLIFRAVITLPKDHVTAAAFKTILDWIYAKEPVLKSGPLKDVYKAALYLRIASLAKQCWLRMGGDLQTVRTMSAAVDF